MQRRQVLALVTAASASVAGCPSSGPSAGPDSTTRSLGETAESSDGTTVTVRDVTLRRLIPSTSVGSATHIDVACPESHQFAVVDVEATGPDGGSVVDDVSMALEVDGTRYPKPDQHWYWAIGGSDDRPGKPAFPVPVAEASAAAVVWSREDGDVARWAVPTEAVDALGRAPAFRVTDFRTPNTIGRNEPVEASFTVANRGSRNGRFVTEFGAGPISDHPETTVAVPTDDERTVTNTLTPHTDSDTEEIEVTLDWGCDQRVHTVTVSD
jgi:hypothetical protein